MDFHSFVRKDLQCLCKLNKIPANRTNLAMAEALSSLKTVKGIEKYCKSMASSAAESSVESPEKNVVTSPKTTRIGRRKQVREGSGVVQTVTPFTRRRNRVPNASVKTAQRVYNTRLSAKLLKKEVMELEKKECVEAVKISSYCDVVSDNDLSEVLEGKNVTGSDNAGVESPVSEMEQESECLKWKDADKYLDLRDTAATNMESKMLENNELQVDTMSESVLEIPSDDNMVVSDKPLHNNKGCLAWLDDVGVDLCLSKTDISTEVLAHEGSVGVGVESPVSKIEQESESLKWKVADKDLGSRDTAAAYVQTKVLENNGLQVDTMLESVLEMPRDGSLVVIDKLLHNKKDDVGIDLCLSRIDISTEVLPYEVSVVVGVESPVSKTEQESESLKWIDADKDLGSSDTAVTNMKSNVLENNGLQVDTMLESVLEMPSNDNMVVIDKPLHNNKDDVEVDLCLPKTDISTEVLAPEGSVYVYIESPVSEIKQESGSLKWKDAYEDLDSRDTAATNMNSKVLENNGSQVDTMLEYVLEMPGDENMVVINQPLHIEKVSVYVDEESPISKTEQERESLQWNGADKDLDLSNTATKNMKSKVLEKNGLQVDTMSEFNLEMPRDDNMLLLDKPLHNKKDDVGVDLCLSKTDVSTEVLAHGVKVFQMNTDNAVVDTLMNEKEAAIPSVSLQGKESVDVGFSFLEKEFHNESPKRVSGESLDAQVTALTDLKVLVLNGKGSDNVGVESPVSEIEQESEHLKWKDAEKDLDLRDIASTNMESKVLGNNELQVDTMSESVLEIPSNDNMVVTDKPLDNKKDDVGIDFCLFKTDISAELLAHEGSVGKGIEFPVSKIEQERESLKWKDADKDLDSRDTPATDMKSKVLEKLGLQVDTMLESVLKMPSDNNMVVIDKHFHNKKDDVGVDLCLPETDISTEVLAPEGSVNLVIESPVCEIKQEIGSMKWKDADEDMDSRDTAATNMNSMNSKVLENNDDVFADVSLSEIYMTTEVLAYEDSEKAVVEMPIHETKVVEQVFSMQKNGSGNVASDLKICSESYERTINSTHNSPGDDNSADTDFFQYNAYSKQSDSKREPVSEILSCNSVVEYSDQSELTDSVEGSNEYYGGLTFVDESGDEDRQADDPESSSEAFDDNSCDTEAGLDFLEYVMQDRKRESVASHILCDSYTEKEPSDQSDTSDSFDSSVGFSRKVASYHQLASGNSLTKESALRVESDVTYCCSGIKNMRFDENEQASEVKSPFFFKQRGQMCPSSAPPVLPPRKAKIACSERSLIVADYPFTQKYMSSGVRALEPTFKLKSNVFKDKENIEENENLGFHKDKNEFPVSKKSDVGLHGRSPR